MRMYICEETAWNKYTTTHAWYYIYNTIHTHLHVIHIHQYMSQMQTL